MKRSFITYSLTAASTLLLVGCTQSNKVDLQNKTQQEGNKKVTRKKTSSGLEYEVIKEGTGVSPQAGKQVTVHYTGWLNKDGQPGTKFDSSVDRNQPFMFTIGVAQVIKGWDEGVLSMKTGEKRRLYIPANLGYGARGAGRQIPANADLIFDVELLQVG